jgi:hypothetical protein
LRERGCVFVAVFRSRGHSFLFLFLFDPHTDTITHPAFSLASHFGRRST